MLEVLVNLKPPPESVPLNALVPVKRTPLENRPPVNPLEMVRMVATTRIFVTRNQVRLSVVKNFSMKLNCAYLPNQAQFYATHSHNENNQMKEDKNFYQNLVKKFTKT